MRPGSNSGGGFVKPGSNNGGGFGGGFAQPRPSYGSGSYGSKEIINMKGNTIVKIRQQGLKNGLVLQNNKS